MAEHARVKPKWQRARITVANHKLAGYFVWVEVGPPSLKAENCTVEVPSDGIRTNIVGARGRIGLPASHAELLAEFADDVPLITLDDFLADCRKHPR